MNTYLITTILNGRIFSCKYVADTPEEAVEEFREEYPTITNFLIQEL